MFKNTNSWIGDYVVPDYMEKQTIYRTWDFENGTLKSYAKNVFWQKKMKAFCNLEKHHMAPNKDCSCGIYGYFDLQSAVAMKCAVVGVCDVWGKAEVHKEGIRVQYASIKALALNNLETLDYNQNFNPMFLEKEDTSTLQNACNQSLQVWAKNNNCCYCKTLKDLGLFFTNTINR